MSPTQAFINAVIYTIGRLITTEVIKKLQPLARNALKRVTVKKGLNSSESSLPPLNKNKQSEKHLENKVSQKAVDDKQAFEFVTKLMALPDIERRELIDRAYMAAKEDHDLAMRYLIAAMLGNSIDRFK